MSFHTLYNTNTEDISPSTPLTGSRLALYAVCAAMILLLSGMLGSCKNQGGDGATGNRQADSAARKQPAEVAQSPIITLPALDALFYEEGFEQDVKSKLGLTADQVARLKTIARESVEELTEEGLGDYSGSAKAAAEKSQQQIVGVIGQAKTDELMRMIAQRYAGGDVDGMMSTTPNAVPKDTRIVVNAPAYRMDVYQEGRLVKTYKVGIGYPEFPLPTGMRRADQLIFNPTWTPPDEPWVKGKFAPGKQVAAGSALNPLGPIKIPIGLPSLIHGGKQPAKLGTFASHGCVGLTDDGIRDFTATLAGIAGSGINADSISALGEKKTQTRTVKLDKPVPVELRYETIVAENGGLHIYRDVYERGTNTADEARRVLDVYGVKYDALPAPEKTALDAALAQMSAGPRTKPDSTAQVAPTADTGRKSGVADSKKAKKGGVTNTIVGQKDVLVPIAALNGKGYPAPVNLYAPGAAATAAK